MSDVGDAVEAAAIENRDKCAQELRSSRGGEGSRLAMENLAWASLAVPIPADPNEAMAKALCDECTRRGLGLMSEVDNIDARLLLNRINWEAFSPGLGDIIAGVLCIDDREDT